ncbi:MAG: hypothetical protein IJ323_06235 [Clostridia bacterium]|nr:hypothetical protein [Clostridia bacterium]
MKKISFKKVFLLVRNNYSINRSLPMILALGICILGAIVGAMPISDLESRYAMRLEAGFATYEEYHMATESIFNEMLGIEGVFSIMFMIVVFALAFFSCISLMGYMRDKSGVDFYHSMSVNRGEIYLAHYVTAFINSAVTVVLSQLLGLFFMDLIAKYPPYSFGEMIVMQLPAIGTAILYLALFLSIAMIAAIISGNVFSTLISYACINFFIPATVLAVAVSGSQLFHSKLLDYLDHKPHIYPYTSPFIRYIFGLDQTYLPFTARSYILVLLGTMALIVLGIWLYGKKKNENSQRPMAFAIFKRPLQYLLAFDMILLGATFFEAITDSLIWCVVGGLIALLFTFIITNAFFDKTFTGVFKKSRHMVFILVVTLIFGAIFVADAFGIYHEVKPNVKNMSYAYVYINYHTSDGYYKNYDFSFENFDEDYYSETVEKLDGNAKKAIIDIYGFIKEIEEGKESQKAVDYYEYEDGRIYEEISVSINFRCEGDFSSYYEYTYLSEVEEGFEMLKSLIDNLIEEYSHNVGYTNPETDQWEHFEVIH